MKSNIAIRLLDSFPASGSSPENLLASGELISIGRKRITMLWNLPTAELCC